MSAYRYYGAEHADGRPYAPEEHPLARAVAGELVENAEVRYRRPDGELRILSANAAPILDGEGQIQAAVVAFFDITARWRAETNLQLLAEASAVLASSLDTNETVRNVVDLAVPRLADLCMLYLRDASHLRCIHLAHANTGLTRRFEALWKQQTTLAPEEHPAFSVVQKGESLHLPEINDTFIQRLATDAEHLDSLRSLSLRSALIVPLTGHSETFGALAFMMTEHGRAFDKLTRQTAEDFAQRAGIALHNAYLYQAINHAVRSRDEILSVVSHDLRSPLEIIRLTAELLRCYATEGAPGGPWLETSAQTLENATQRMGRLIDDLLDLANIRAGRLGIMLQAEQALSLLTEASTMHQELATSLGRRLVVEIAPELGPVQLLCDRIRILQVFGNLIDNALRYAPEGTAVRLCAERVGNTARLSVADKGMGIPQEEQEHIFKRFWKKDRDRAGGAGLGLFISQAIVKAHGGHLWVESTPGAGTQFLFTLPIAA